MDHALSSVKQFLLCILQIKGENVPGPLQGDVKMDDENDEDEDDEDEDMEEVS